MKIVLDTNCLVVSIPLRSKYRWLWNAFREKRFTLCYTTEILHEYHEILSHFYSPELAENVINEILNSENTDQITVFYKWNLIEIDPDDNKFIDCAISAGTELIVSNDKHFKVLEAIAFPKMVVVNLQEFKNLII